LLLVVTVNRALVAPPLTVTDAGTLGTGGLLLCRFTAVPRAVPGWRAGTVRAGLAVVAGPGPHVWGASWRALG